MAGTDFFDEDLENREAMRRRPTENALGRPVSDLNLTRMARHKDEIETQVASSAQELDRLRMRQEELERERRELEELRKKQDGYERGRREISERLDQSMIMMEKEQLRAQRLVDLLTTTRQEFKMLFDGIDEIDPEGWPDDKVREELGKALVVIDEARMEYNKGITRVEAAMADGGKKSGGESSLITGDGVEGAGGMSFGSWLKAGLAFSLPLILTLGVMAVGYLVLKQKGLL